MPAFPRVTIPNPDDKLTEYGPGALIYGERADTEAGVYAQVFTEPIEATKFFYEIPDPTGDNTKWYRIRYGNSGATLFSQYGEPFSGDEPPAYATIDDLLLAKGQPTTDTRYIAEAERKLTDATNDLDAEIGYTHFRTPRTGTETRLFNGNGTCRLHVHEGIAQLDLVEIRLTPGGSWTPLVADDWYLEAEPNQLTPRPGDPYFHVALAPNRGYTVFPRFPQSVRLTLATGWPTVLSSWRVATVAWARQRLAMDPSIPGGPMGPEEMGSPVGPDLWPRAVYDLVQREARRHSCAN